MALFRFWNGNPGTEAARITWNNTDGKIYVFDSTLTGGVATSVAASLNQWVRVEFKVVCDASVGIVEAKLFNTADSATADATATKSAGNTLAQVTRFAVGSGTAVDVSAVFWLDDLNINGTGYPGPAVTAAQKLRPSADSVDGAWTNQAGNNTNLFDSIDEAAASDADYIQSELAPSSSAVRMKLATGTNPAAGTRFFRWRIGKDAAGGATINMTARVYQGGGNSVGAGTLVQEFTRNGVDAATTYEETLTGTVTDYADLYVEFRCTQA